MAKVDIQGDALVIQLSLLDKMLAFHGSFHIPMAHVTNAYVSNFEELGLEFRLLGTGLGMIKDAGIFTNAEGVIFCDVHGAADCLVIETHGERFPRIAVT